jgi:transposase
MGHPKGTKNRMRSAEEKADLIERFKSGAVSEREFEAENGIHESTFCAWLRKYESGGVEALRSRTEKLSRGRKQSLAKKKNRTREEELEYENLKLKIELERAKKGYSVKGGGSRKEFVPIGRRNTR